MAKIKAKALISVEIPEPSENTMANLPAKGKDRTVELRNHVETVILRELKELNPKIQRLNLSRTKEGKNDK